MSTHTTDIPIVRAGQVLTSATLNDIIAELNGIRWERLLDAVRADARAQVDAMAARWGLL